MRENRLWTLVCVGLLAAGVSAASSAGEIKVFSTIDVQGALEKLAPGIETATGDKLDFTWGTSVILAQRVQAGEVPDLMILTRQSLEKLGTAGKVVAGSQADIAESVIAVAVKEGAPKPDISTVAAFKESLLHAKSIAFSNPVAGGASGVYVAKLLGRLGVAKRLQGRIKYPPPSGNSALLVANGEAEMAIQQEPELLSVPGIELLGPLPEAINKVTVVSAAIGAGTRQPKAAAELIALLHGPQATAALEAKGLVSIAGPQAR